MFFCCSGGGVFYFLLFGQGRGPHPNSKNKKSPEKPKQQKDQTTKRLTLLPERERERDRVFSNSDLEFEGLELGVSLGTPGTGNHKGRNRILVDDCAGLFVMRSQKGVCLGLL